MATFIEKAQTRQAQADSAYSPEQAQATAQYTIWHILGIWLAGGAPMWLLAWIVYPAASQHLAVTDAALLRMGLLTIGLAWQFVLSMIIAYQEKGSRAISLSKFLAFLRQRFWLNNPVSPRTGRKDNRLW